VKVGSDMEFDQAMNTTGHPPDEIARNNRVVIAFEQFTLDGKRFVDNQTKYGFEIDMYGNCYPTMSAASRRADLRDARHSGRDSRGLWTRSTRAACVLTRSGACAAFVRCGGSKPRWARRRQWRAVAAVEALLHHFRPPVGGSGWP
jgi:hypothetical protein